MRNLYLDYEYRLRPRLDPRPESGTITRCPLQGRVRDHLPRASVWATKARPELDRLLASLRTGDTVYVYKLDRLGRSLKHLLDMVAELEFRDVGLVSLTDAINTTSAHGRLVVNLFASLAEFERELIRERTHAGLASARARGRVGGRRRGLSEEAERTAIVAETLYQGTATRREQDCPALAYLQGDTLQIPAPPRCRHPQPPESRIS